jgi:ribonuclease J
MARVTLHGGVGEIGGCKFLVDDGETRILLDFGLSFGDRNAYFAEFMQPRSKTAGLDLLKLGHLPAVDGIYRRDVVRVPGSRELGKAHPEARDLWDAGLRSYGEVLEETGEAPLDAVVLTHAHLDHVGHVGYLDPRIPVDCTPATKRLVEAVETVSGTPGFEGELVQGATLEASEIGSGGNFPGAKRIRGEEEWTRPYRAREPYEPFEVGSMTVRLVPVDHSVPGAAAIHVETGDGSTLFYTGDVRFHGRFDELTDELREEAEAMDPDLMLCEGTRVTSDQADDEADVRAGLVDRYRGATGLGLVDFAWKDTTRFQTLQEVAEATDRTLAVSYKLAYAVKRLASLQEDLRPVEAYPNVRVYVPRKRSSLYSKQDYNRGSERLQLGYQSGDWDPEAEDALVHWEEGVRAPEIRERPGDFLLQLSQWSMTELLDLEPPEGSVFVRAACEPFSEEMDLDLQRQARWLDRYGIPVDERGDDEAAIPEVEHASGHASGPDLLDLVDRVDPDRVLPVHTEDPQVFEEHRDDVVPWPEDGDAPLTVTF